MNRPFEPHGTSLRRQTVSRLSAANKADQPFHFKVPDPNVAPDDKASHYPPSDTRGSHQQDRGGTDTYPRGAES
jgi:hypothetical protein